MQLDFVFLCILVIMCLYLEIQENIQVSGIYKYTTIFQMFLDRATEQNVNLFSTRIQIFGSILVNFIQNVMCLKSIFHPWGR